MKADTHAAGTYDRGTFDRAALNAWWQLQGEWVEEPNVRRDGSSGVQRIHDKQGRLLYAKRQVGHLYRSLRHPLGSPTVLRERAALLGARKAGVNVPEIVYCAAEQGPDGWRGLLITAALDGFQALDEWYAQGGRERHGEPQHERLLQEIATNLARLHLARWQHGCLNDKHIFVRITGAGEAAQVDVALLDLEKCRRRLTRTQAALHDLRQLKRHSAWNEADWQRLIDAYQATFGSAIKGLPA
jgi:tRNA A-37 threonylcarbamoyl transferase component Bud32